MASFFSRCKWPLKVAALALFGLWAEAFGQSPLLYPIEPGKRTSLTGNMGELRTNHFHGGLDIRTGYRTGLPVYASADGYVSYVQVSSHGYGNMLHVKHANGLVTVYAHLEDFRADLQALANAEQRDKDAFEVELYPAAGLYKVQKGEVIGLSGNSGSSGGPHLHYEIRDTNDIVLNPMHFGFAEIEDRLSPYISGLYVRTFGINSRANGSYGLARIPVKHLGNHNYTAGTFTAQGSFGFEVLARDRINNGTQHTGVTCIELRIDDREVYSVNIERFAFRQTGHINVHIDYELFRATGERYQKIFQDDGNAMAFGRDASRRGFISQADTGLHRYEIICYDAYGNKCRLSGTYKMVADPLYAAAKASNSPPKIGFDVSENVLKIEAAGPATFLDSMGVFVGPRWFYLPPRYVQGGKNTYLYDLRLGVPDSIGGPGYKVATKLVGAIPSGQAFRAVSSDWQINFRLSTLFDTCYLAVEGKPQDGVFTLGPADQPMFTYLDVKARFNGGITSKQAFYLESGGRLKWLKTEIRGDSLCFETKYLGKYRLLTDSTPPLARMVQAGRKGVRILVSDNLSGIADFHAYLNKKTLAMQYDHKRNLVWITEDEVDLAGPGRFEFVIRDNCGNEKRLETTIL